MNPLPPHLRPAVEYPDSDGKPLESDVHRTLMVDLIGALDRRFRDDPLFYVTGNLFVYYKEGEPRENVGPDVFAVRGVPRRRRPCFKVWEEGRAPELVIELSSKKTFRRDLGVKKSIYEELGVLEYYVFDPLGELLAPRLRGFRRAGDELHEITGEERADGTIVFSSEYLGLELHGRGEDLRLVDPATGERLPTNDEVAELTTQAREETERARAEAESLARENARLREELERLSRERPRD